MLQQALADVACRHPHHGILRRVVGHRFPEQRHADAALPQVIEFRVQRPFHNVLEEVLAALTAFERNPVDDLFEVLPEFRCVLRYFADFCNRGRMGCAVGSTSHLGLSISPGIGFRAHPLRLLTLSLSLRRSPVVCSSR